MPNPDGRPPQYGKRKGRTQITLSQQSKDLLKKEHAGQNPIAQAGWSSLSALVEAMLRGEVEVPSPPGTK